MHTCSVPKIHAIPPEAVVLVANGYEMVKVFPIESIGGTAFLKSLSSVFPNLKRRPMAGVTIE